MTRGFAGSTVVWRSAEFVAEAKQNGECHPASQLIGVTTEHDLRLVILARCLREEPGQVARTLDGLRWAVVTVGPDVVLRAAARVTTATDVIRAVVGIAGKRS